MKKLLFIGFDTYIPISNLLAITSPISAPIKRRITEAKRNSTILDATFGRKTRSVMITTSNQIILSAIQADTIAKRYNKKNLIIKNVPRLLSIGYENYVLDNIISLIVSSNTSPIKKRIEDAKKENLLIDATFGKKTRSVIVTVDNYLLTTTLLAETISKRYENINNLDMKTEENKNINKNANNINEE